VPILRAVRKRFFDVRPGEGPKAAGLAAYFFLVIAVFWILKPLKRGLLIGFFGEGNPITFAGLAFSGAEAEQVGKVLNMVVAYGVVVGFTWLARRLARHHLVLVFCAAFAGLFALFATALGDLGAPGVWAFYVLGDVWTTVMVATFWAFANDLNTGEEAERLYGLVGLGGVVGGFVGASVVSRFVEGVGRAPLLVGALVPLAAIAGLVAWLHHREQAATGRTDADPCCPDDDGGGTAAEGGSDPGEPPPSAIVEGAQVVLRSRYLICIAVILGLYEVASNVIDFQFGSMVEAEFAGAERDAYFAFVGQLTSGVSIVVQLVGTTFVLNRYGVRTALFVLPAVVLVGSAGFLALPTLALASALSVADNGLNYSIQQSAKEALYTPTSQDATYKAKAFIDMFVQRAAKVVAVGLNLLLPVALTFASVRWLSIPVVLVALGWLAVARHLGAAFTTRAAEQEAEAAGV
jgi:AAA family ATP:ADP antiporter